MNPIWISAVVGAVLGRQRKRFRDGSTPEDRCPAKRVPRTPWKSLLAFLRGMVKWVRGSRGTRRLGLRKKKSMKRPRSSTEKEIEPRRVETVIRECDRREKVWLEPTVFMVLITGAERKSVDGVTPAGVSSDCSGAWGRPPLEHIRHNGSPESFAGPETVSNGEKEWTVSRT